MPATAGKVRMPHNNRMTTSNSLKTSDMWSKTIGHDPHANREDEGTDAATAAADAQKAKSLMELARLQNVAGRARDGGGDGGASATNEFARQAWLGLKGGKKRRADVNGAGGAGAAGAFGAGGYGHGDSSSSEDEYVEEAAQEEAAMADAKQAAAAGGGDGSEALVEKDSRKRRFKKDEKKRRKRSSKKRKKRGSSSSSSSDDSSSSSSSSSDESRERRRRRKRRRDRDDDRRYVVGRREVAGTGRGAVDMMAVIVIPRRMTNRGRDDVGSIGGSIMIMMERRAGRAGIEITNFLRS